LGDTQRITDTAKGLMGPEVFTAEFEAGAAGFGVLARHPGA
jgi:hypothetical protein